LAGLVGFQQLPVDLHPYSSTLILVSDYVELTVSPFILAGETEQFEKKGAETSIGGLLLDILGKGHDRG
jgi:hypothetical protein